MAFRVIAAMAVTAVSSCAASRALTYPSMSFENRSAAIRTIATQSSDANRKPLAQSSGQSGRKRAPCPVLRTPPPTSDVTRLHPCHIEVVGAIGDSITTADNAKSTNWVNLRQYQGLAWSIGGDPEPEATTLPNLLQDSCGRQPVGASIGEGAGAKLNLNRARSGSVVQDLPGLAIDLRTSLQEELGDQYTSSWKHLTVLTGGNNLCIVCQDRDRDSNNETVYEQGMREAMRELVTIPRAVISISLHLDYTDLAKLVDQFGCWLIMPSVCPCLGVDNEARLEISREYIKKYNEVIRKLVAEFNRENDRNPTTRFVYQPFMENTYIAEAAWISRADCFHPSADGQSFIGRGLFINLFEKVGEKRNEVKYEDMVCPTESSVIGV